MKRSLGAQTWLYPTPVLVIGTYDPHDRPNAMTVAWGGICCSQPPCVAVSVRKSRHTYANLMHHRAFTVNIPSENQVKIADYFGMASGKTVDKFAATGLTPVKSSLVAAPYISEFPLILECQVVHTYDLGIHSQFIGEILDVKVDENKVGADGVPMLEMLKPILYIPGENGYRRSGDLLMQAFTVRKAPTPSAP
jgi:flavin reductase (DIM6/NTAB) family NADH-FMN oxidoreductase RutF